MGLVRWETRAHRVRPYRMDEGRWGRSERDSSTLLGMTAYRREWLRWELEQETTTRSETQTRHDGSRDGCGQGTAGREAERGDAAATPERAIAQVLVVPPCSVMSRPPTACSDLAPGPYRGKAGSSEVCGGSCLRRPSMPVWPGVGRLRVVHPERSQCRVIRETLGKSSPGGQ